MPTTKRKKEDFRRAANAKGQTKLPFAKKPSVGKSSSSGPDPNQEIDVLCGEGEVCFCLIKLMNLYPLIDH